MNIFARLKYRFGDPLPEYKEKDSYGTYYVRVVSSGMFGSDSKSIFDAESKLWRRRIRAIITGRGRGYTMGEALWDWALPKVVIAIGLGALLVALHAVQP